MSKRAQLSIIVITIVLTLALALWSLVLEPIAKRGAERPTLSEIGGTLIDIPAPTVEVSNFSIDRYKEAREKIRKAIDANYLDIIKEAEGK